MKRRIFPNHSVNIVTDKAKVKYSNIEKVPLMVYFHFVNTLCLYNEK